MKPSVAASPGSAWLTFGGVLSLLAAALLHVAVIFGGGDWYRFFGAGEELARAAEQGSPVPALITLAIAAVLATWALYAFSGAGRMARLPLLRTALVAITAIYLGRGLTLAPLLVIEPQAIGAYDLWSSLFVLAYGLAHALGPWRAWPALASPAARPSLGA